MNELCHRLTQRNDNKFHRLQWVRNNQFPQIFTFSHVVAAKKENMELGLQFIRQQEGGLRKELLRTSTWNNNIFQVKGIVGDITLSAFRPQVGYA